SPHVSQILDPNRQDGKENNEQDYLFEVLVYPGNRTQIEPSGRHGADPKDSTEDVVAGKSRVRHLGNACNHGRKSPGKGNEAREENGLAAVLFIELFCVEQMLAAEPKRIFLGIESLSGLVTDAISQRISDDSHNTQQHHEISQIEEALRSNQSRSKQKRITRKKKSDE